MKKIFALVGMCGSGKSTASDMLIELNWEYIRFGQATIDKLQAEGKAITPENEKSAREALREQYGMGAFATLALPKVEKALEEKNVVIDGLYSWSEYKILKAKFSNQLVVVAIYSSPKTRYARLEVRTTDENDTAHRMRVLTEEEAKKRDFVEIENIEKGGPIAMADVTFINESTSSELAEKIKELALH